MTPRASPLSSRTLSCWILGTTGIVSDFPQTAPSGATMFLLHQGCRTRFARRTVGGGILQEPRTFPVASAPREVTLHASLPSFTSSVAAIHVQTCVKRPFSIVFTRDWRRIRVPIPTQRPYWKELSECVPVRPRSRRDASRFPTPGNGGSRRRVCPHGHGPNRVSRGKTGPIRNRREKDSRSPSLMRGFPDKPSPAPCIRTRLELATARARSRANTTVGTAAHSASTIATRRTDRDTHVRGATGSNNAICANVVRHSVADRGIANGLSQSLQFSRGLGPPPPRSGGLRCAQDRIMPRFAAGSRHRSVPSPSRG